MTGPKCTASTIVFAKRFSVKAKPDPTGSELLVPLNAKVREEGVFRGTVKDFFERRFVKLNPPVRLPCVGTGVWKQAVDDYILELGRLTGQKGTRFDVAPAIYEYLEGYVQSPTTESTHPIATPERFEVYFLERSQKFDGKFDASTFRRTMTEAIAKALKPLADRHWHMTKPVQGQKISDGDRLRLEAAEKLAIAWLPQQSSEGSSKLPLIRRNMGKILDAITGRRVINYP